MKNHRYTSFSPIHLEVKSITCYICLSTKVPSLFQSGPIYSKCSRCDCDKNSKCMTVVDNREIPCDQVRVFLNSYTGSFKYNSYTASYQF